MGDYNDEEFICSDHNENLHIANIKVNIWTFQTVRVLLKTKKQISLFSHPVWSLRGGVSHPHYSDSWWWSARCWWPLLLLTFINDHTSHERCMAIIQWIIEMQTKNRQIKWHLKKLVAQLDHYFYFNIQRTEKYSIVMCYTWSGDDGDDDDNVDWTIDQEINDYSMHPHCTAQSWQRNRKKEKINRSSITHGHTSEPKIEHCEWQKNQP